MRADANYVLSFVRQVAGTPAVRCGTDGELLERYGRFQDADAFASLVARHSPMVLHLCRRMLGDVQAAEDACQAVFLVLARRAGSLARPQALAGWLYGVAYRTARKARTALARRRLREADYPDTEFADPRVDPLAELSARELLNLVEDEIQKLPEAYRLPLVLCCIEGQSREEAARQLGCAPGAIKGRLERGRARLQARLARRGMTLAAAFAAIETSRAAARALPSPALRAVVAAARGFAVSPGAVFTGEVSSTVRELASAMVRELTVRRYVGRILLGAVLGVASGAGVAGYHFGATDRGSEVARAEALGAEPPPRTHAARSDRQPDPSRPPSPDRAPAEAPRGLLHERVVEEALAIGDATITVRREASGDKTRMEIVVRENSGVERYATAAQVPARYQDAVKSLLDRLEQPPRRPGIPPGL
jgi:RNA polymerase sigma factor (sigma-70 family)